MSKGISKKIAVIIYGSPGSGKGTQAELLAKKIGLFHFDTGNYLRRLFNNSKISLDELKELGITKKEFQTEKIKNETGKLNLPNLVLKIVNRRINHLADLGQSIILSGSPRTIFESFGVGEAGKKTSRIKNGGIFELLEKKYGKKNIYIFILDIPESESIKRNSARSVCSVCKTPMLSQMPKCPFCGGKIEHRRDDRKEVIIGRLKEYHERTEPIFKKLKEYKYGAIRIDGTPEPYKVHQKIISYFKQISD